MLRAMGGGGEAVTKLLLLNPSLFPWNQENRIREQHWSVVYSTHFALETNWQGCLIHASAAQAAKHVSSCGLGYTHL